MSLDKVRKQFWDTPDKEKPAAVVVDAVGMGGPIADILRRDGLPIVHWMSSENSSQKTLYRNKRSEMWHLGREWFEQQNVVIPDDDELVEELAAPTRFVPEDKNTAYGSAYIIESKKDIKERIGRSTDLADGLLLSLCAKWRERDADYLRDRLPGMSGRKRKPTPAGATWMSAI